MKEEIKKIEVPEVWLKDLLKYADRTKKLSEEDAERNLKIALPELLGYISSAKVIIKHKGTGKQKIEVCDDCEQENHCADYKGKRICQDCWAKKLTYEEIYNL